MATGLKWPWEITWGPDNFLWVTERTAGRITRIDPKNGTRVTAITIPGVSAHSGQDGLLGYRVPLAADGRKLRGPIERYFQSENRFRDTALSPDKKTIYVATDPGGLAESLSSGVARRMQKVDPCLRLCRWYSPLTKPDTILIGDEQ